MFFTVRNLPSSSMELESYKILVAPVAPITAVLFKQVTTGRSRKDFNRADSFSFLAINKRLE